MLSSLFVALMVFVCCTWAALPLANANSLTILFSPTLQYYARWSSSYWLVYRTSSSTASLSSSSSGSHGDSLIAKVASQGTDLLVFQQPDARGFSAHTFAITTFAQVNSDGKVVKPAQTLLYELLANSASTATADGSDPSSLSPVVSKPVCTVPFAVLAYTGDACDALERTSVNPWTIPTTPKSSSLPLPLELW